MNIRYSNYPLFLITLWVGGILFLAGCKKDPVLPGLSTTDASEVTVNTANTGGNITSDGGAEITARGVCWGTSSEPIISGPHTSDSKGSGSYLSNLTGLTPATTYYVRAYAVNEAGTAYGNEISFETMPMTAPVLTTLDVTAVTSNTAVCGGNITSDGGIAVTARGVCWSVTANPTTSGSKTSDGSGTGSFASDLTGLQPGVTYHVRAYAINSIGTAYGNELTFTTQAVRPTLTTLAVSNITRNTAVSGGNITNSGGATVTSRGVCWGTSSGPVSTGPHTTDGEGTGTFSSNLTGLNPNTTYYVRAYATNSAGTAYGNEMSFPTEPVSAPTLSTSGATDITLTTAVAGGTIISDNGAEIIERGVCWNTTGNPSISGPHTSNGTGIGSFTVNIEELSAGTIYYVRAYARNSVGTAYGDQILFSTSISDIENNVYKTVAIGSQLWMKSDLKTTRFSDNLFIPNITESSVWTTITSPAYCWYDNTPSYGSTYGILYNWYAVETDKLCPLGWHVPTDEEYNTMEQYLGMPLAEINLWDWRGTDQGSQMKSSTLWDGTNTSGFSGLPGGYRRGDIGNFYALGILTYWWTGSESISTEALYRRLDTSESKVYRHATSKRGGKFVRCIKN